MTAHPHSKRFLCGRLAVHQDNHGSPALVPPDAGDSAEGTRGSAGRHTIADVTVTLAEIR